MGLSFTETRSSQHINNVESTLIQRQDVESTLNRRCLNVVCPLFFFRILLDFGCMFQVFSGIFSAVVVIFIGGIRCFICTMIIKMACAG